MTDNELYEMARSEYRTATYSRWLADQTDDDLFRLHAGLSVYRECTLIVRSTHELARAETHAGPVVFRDDTRDWFDHCDNICILEDVIDVLGKRLYSALHSDDLETVLRADRPDARRVLADWLKVVADRVGQSGGPTGVDTTYDCESRLVRTSGMSRHNRPELGIRDVPLFLVGPVGDFLREVSAQVLTRPGDARLGEMMTVSNGVQFRLVLADPPGIHEYRPSEVWRLADVGESFVDCDQAACTGG